MSRRILVVHYTPPRVVGGVESVILEHARLLTERGFEVQIVAGQEGSSGMRVHVVPELNVAAPEAVALENELAQGLVGPRFWHMRGRILERLVPLASGAHRVIVHNALTLHFSLPLTSVAWHLAATVARRRVIAWCHDLSWTNPLYVSTMHPGHPWDLLRYPAPGVQYVTVSSERRGELLALWGVQVEDVIVVPNGIDPMAFLRLSPTARDIARRHHLADRDMVLLLPVRITRRKNVELAIRAVKALANRGVDVLFLVSGPTAPHHPVRSMTYLDELKQLCASLAVEERVIFLADTRDANLTTQTVSELYALSDALLLPSTQEGFGLPILEAGLARVPVILTNIPVFREVGGEHVHRFDLQDDPDTIAAKILGVLEGAQSRLYRRVLREYSWDSIIEGRLLPLLEGPSVGKA
jgi:glycosyltransferase involved in cell wall biosynthesis